MKKQTTGALGEKIAADFLKKKGYKVLENNYRRPEGEIDIIYQIHDTLVFVEVKTRRNRRFGTPEEAITKTKEEHLRALAERYRQEHEGLPENWRIDVVAIEMGSGGKVKRIEIIENAVEG